MCLSDDGVHIDLFFPVKIPHNAETPCNMLVFTVGVC